MKRNPVLLSLSAVALVLSMLVVVRPPSTRAQTAELGGRLEVLLCNPLIKQLGMGNVWEAAKAVGVRGIEISVNPDLSCPDLYVGNETPYKLDSPENAWRIRTDALNNNLETPVLVAPIELIPDEIRVSGAPEWAMELVRVAPHVGAKLIYFPILTENFMATTIPDDAFVESAVFLLNDLVAQGNRFGVEIAFENLSVYWNRPEIAQKVLQEFTPQELGICLDPVNFYWYGHPLSRIPDLIKEMLPYTKHFHAKNVNHPEEKRQAERDPGWMYSEHSVSVEEGDLDFEQYIRLLVDTQYDGYVSIENDSLGKAEDPRDRLEILKRDVEYLERIIKGYRPGVG